MGYSVASVDLLERKLRNTGGDFVLLIPSERYRGRLELNLEKAIRRIDGAEYGTSNSRAVYWVRRGNFQFNVKIYIDGV